MYEQQPPYLPPSTGWHPDERPAVPAHPSAQPRLAWNNARPHHEFSHDVAHRQGVMPAPSTFPGSTPIRPAIQHAEPLAMPMPMPMNGAPYVQPGLMGGESPMSLAHGAIEPAYAHGASAQVVGGGGAGAGAVPGMMQQQPVAQRWGYATPHGLQVVEGGAPQYVDQSQTHPVAVATITRVRWGVVVPTIALILFAIAAAMFVRDFDRITGRSTNAAPQSTTAQRDAGADDNAAATQATTPATEDAPMLAAADVQQRLTRARALLAAGRYDEVSSLLHDMLNAPNADRFPAIARLHQVADARAERERVLLTRLGSQQSRSDWNGAVKTLTALKQLRPLSRDEQGILRTARAKVAAKSRAATAAAAESRQAAASSTTARGGGSAPRPSGSAAPSGPSSSSTGRPAGKPPAPSSGTTKPPKPPTVANTGGGGNGIGAHDMNGMNMAGMDMGAGHDHAH